MVTRASSIESIFETPYLKNTKIVVTLGPASSDIDTIRAMVEAGANVFRLNMSHGSHADHKLRYELVRKVEEQLGRPLGVLVDLQGPKIRCGTFTDDSYILKPGDFFTFDSTPSPGNATRVQLPHPKILSLLDVGTTILVNDGKIAMEVIERSGNSVKAKVTTGGVISDRKGVNFPGIELPVTSLSKKDLNDLDFGCRLGADWVALSFVQRASDITDAKKIIGDRASVIAKIEKPAAVENFKSILDAADGVMVARGDLGVELPLPDLPPIQKQLVAMCRSFGKPVIVATQMLESMIESPLPTRAEISDVAGAIYEGADAVMLSAESATGHFPIVAVNTMRDVALKVEADPTYRRMMDATNEHEDIDSTSSVITIAARGAAQTEKIRAICCFSHSGMTARLASRERPSVPILAITPFINVARQLTLYSGLTCVLSDRVKTFEQAVETAVLNAKCLNLDQGNFHIAVTAGVPFNEPGSTNILRIASVIHNGPNSARGAFQKIS